MQNNLVNQKVCPLEENNTGYPLIVSATYDVPRRCHHHSFQLSSAHQANQIFEQTSRCDIKHSNSGSSNNPGRQHNCTIQNTNQASKTSKNYESGFPTKSPIKLSTNLPTNVLAVATIRIVNKPSTNEATVFTIKADSPTTKPDRKCNNNTGGQRVVRGAADDIMPGQSRNKVKQKDAALA